MILAWCCFSPGFCWRHPPVTTALAFYAGTGTWRGEGSWRGALAVDHPEAVMHFPFSYLISQQSILSLPSRVAHGCSPTENQKGRVSILTHLPRASAATSPLWSFVHSGHLPGLICGWTRWLGSEAGGALSEKGSRSLAQCCLSFALCHISWKEMNRYFLLGAIILLVAFLRCRHPAQMWFISL